jgi:hypothetical protein
MPKADLTELLEQTIIAGFPELTAVDISIDWAKDLDGLLELGELEDNGYFIEVDKSLRNASIDVLTGGIAHELAHIITDQNETIMEKLLYKFSAHYRTATERNTDLTAILRGYGHRLLAFMAFACKEWSYYPDDGLSAIEIKLLTTKGD